MRGHSGRHLWLNWFLLQIYFTRCDARDTAPPLLIQREALADDPLFPCARPFGIFQESLWEIVVTSRQGKALFRNGKNTL